MALTRWRRVIHAWEVARVGDVGESGELRFDQGVTRFCLDDWELHCGDVLQVQVAGMWLPVRIEYGHDHPKGWYLVTEDHTVILPHGGMKARPRRPGVRR